MVARENDDFKYSAMTFIDGILEVKSVQTEASLYIRQFTVQQMFKSCLLPMRKGSIVINVWTLNRKIINKKG